MPSVSDTVRRKDDLLHGEDDREGLCWMVAHLELDATDVELRDRCARLSRLCRDMLRELDAPVESERRRKGLRARARKLGVTK